MGAFFQQYGIEDERRSRIVWRVVYTVLALIVVSILAYFVFHDRSEKNVVRNFIQQINEKHFGEAYRDWGCTPAHPCPNYDYQRFLQDWGPEKKVASPWKIASVDSCRAFLTVNVTAEGAELQSLSVQRADKSLGFAPSPECQERQWRWKQFFSRIFGGSSESKP